MGTVQRGTRSLEESDMAIDRRTFLKLAGGTAACACAGALGISGCALSGAARTPAAPEGSYRRAGDQVIVSLQAAGELEVIGAAARLALDAGETKLIVVHPEDHVYLAFADQCTHNGKELDYLHDERELCCRSRKSRFGLAGGRIRGPAAGDLSLYPVRRQQDDLVIEVGFTPTRPPTG
jgi:nitrite reductase/ring-hydroxylating ferredoxin subunit